MTTAKTVKLTHPTSQQTIEVAPEHVDTYLTQGWKKPEAKSSDSKS